MIKRIIIVGAIVTLFGCSSVPVPQPNISQLNVQENLLQICPDIPVPKSSGTMSMGELYDYTNKLMFQYNDCAMVHDKLVESIREVQSTK